MSGCLKACQALSEAITPVVDAKNLRFVDPFGICLLGATFHKLQRQGKQVNVIGLSPELAGYLQRMDLFQNVLINGKSHSVDLRHNRSDALVELTCLRDHHAVDHTANRLSKAIVGKLPEVDPNEKPDEMTGMTTAERYQDPIQYSLSELLENALTHARRSGHSHACVWVASQYYPRTDEIKCAVVDDGCGFLETLKSHPKLSSHTHHSAILAAMQPRVSCNRALGIRSDTVNQGVGLTTTCRITLAAGGGMLIASGDALHATASSKTRTGSFWTGVAISMNFYRQKLPDVRYRELLPPFDAAQLPPLRFE